MSGGRLVVLDRGGREVKRYPLSSGLATLGSDPRCDIRVMLPAVSPHHATVVVHTAQTVVRNVGSGETLVNGQAVSVAALAHGDLLSVGGRSLRWEYDRPVRPDRPARPDRPDRPERPALDAQPALYLPARKRQSGRGGRTGRRATGPPPAPRSPSLQLALEMQHRASMPGSAGSAGGKQVAIVQPQRRAAAEHNVSNRTSDESPRRPERSEAAPSPGGRSDAAEARRSPAAHNATKASMWIESRKTSPRKSVKTAARSPSPRKSVRVHTPPAAASGGRRAASSKKATPLRMAVLRRAQSAHKVHLMKIQAPTQIDHTKQAAIMLMTGHTPKSKIVSPKQGSSKKTTPTLVIKKPSPVRRTPRPRTSHAPPTPTQATPTTTQAPPTPTQATPTSTHDTPATPEVDVTVTPAGSSRRSSKRGSGGKSLTILEISDSTPHQSTIRESAASRRSRASPPHSPLLTNPKKSALKDPSAKRTSRKTESIKFDLSNLENYTGDTGNQTDVLAVTNTTRTRSDDSASEDELTLHYSDTSSTQSPSPRKSIHSRSSKILEKSLGSLSESSLQRSARGTLTPKTPNSPSGRKSVWGSLIVQKALETSLDDARRFSRRTTKTLTDHSNDTTVASAYRTRTLSPKSPTQNNLETYSIVDLVSIDSNESGRSASVYNSANSSAVAFGTPQNSAGRRTRSTIDPSLVESSTPYVGKVTRKSRSTSSLNVSRKSFVRNASESSKRSKLSTPENTKKSITIDSMRISRGSRSRSRISDSDYMLISDNSVEGSPTSSKKKNSTESQSSLNQTKYRSSNGGGDVTPNADQTQEDGMHTPENRNSPEEVGTPVLSIQSLLDSSQSSLSSQRSQKTGRALANLKRKTIGVIRSEARSRRSGVKSKSLSFSARRGLLRLSNDSSTKSDKTDEGASQPTEDKMVTPKSAVKLVQEAVKNKHSTAKKPQSKRSIIDNLDESDIVKQLFNSPVKRKLSQSMTEFSRKNLFDDEDVEAARRPTRNTIATTARTPDESIIDQTEVITPDRFVSPIATPSNSPNLTGIKRLFSKNTPENDLRNVGGVKSLLRTPRPRKSIKNDLTNVTGIKKVFRKSPKNRLSDVRVKEVFAASPKNDLTRVSGVRALFETRRTRNSPRNDLTDVRGVKDLFKRTSPANDLRRVSGVKRALQRNSPKNDLTDVRGVRRMFREEKRKKDYTDVSGIEELFNESGHSGRDTDSLFDQLIGKPPIKAVYSKSLLPKPVHVPKTRRRSLNADVEVITTNVEEWLEKELQRRLQKQPSVEKKTLSSGNTTRNTTRELQLLATDTVEGAAPILPTRARPSTSRAETRRTAETYSTHTLPLKKRSLAEAPLEASSVCAGKRSLPLKKRVVHSTPVKGRPHVTMNASELGRVSPIVAVDVTEAADRDTSLRSSKQPKEPSTLPLPEPKTKGRRATKAKAAVETEAKETASKPSPRKTRGKAAAVASPKPRATRGRSTKVDGSITGPRKGRASLVIAKKPPVMTPKPASRTRRGKVDPEKSQKEVSNVVPEKNAKPSPKKVVPSPKKTRGKKQSEPAEKKVTNTPKKTRGRKEVIDKNSEAPSPKKTRTRKAAEETLAPKSATPKRNTRAKAQKATVVVSKPSPVLKPRGTKTRGAEAETEATTRRSRKTTANENTSKASPERSTKRRKVDSIKPSQRVESETATAQPKRGRKIQVEEKPKKTRATKDSKASKETSKSVEKAPRTRGAKASEPNSRAEPTRRGRNKAEPQPIEVQTETRKRKSKTEETIPTKVSKTKTDNVVETNARRGWKTTLEAETATSAGKQKRLVVKESKVLVKRVEGDDGQLQNMRVVRSRRVVEVTTTSAQDATSTRRGKTAASKEIEPKAINSRKRKTEVAESPVKVPPKKTEASRKTRVAAASPPPVASTRTRRNNKQTEEGAKTGGRSRRR